MRDPLPVTLVTGFLGAGKTTLVNHLLGIDTGKRFAIVENEFGDVGVDGSLVSAPRETVFELNDGCVCCTVRDDLLAVFEQLTACLEGYDHVLIEASGLADPAPVMRLFDIPAVRDAFTLDGVVTVGDAGHLEQSLQEVATSGDQVAYADKLILNKADRLSDHELESIEARLRQLHPLATIRRAVHGQVDVNEVLDLGGRPMGEGGRPEPTHTVHGHRHDDAIRSVAVEAAGDVDVETLDRWLGQLIRRRSVNVLRMKGILSVPKHPQRFVFHGVRDVIDVRPDRPWGTESPHNRVVFIGRGLDPAALQAGFSACIYPLSGSVSHDG